MRFIDVSSNNHPNGAPIDWQAVADAGIQGAIIKVTESDYTNPIAKDDYHGAEAAGFAALGLYDFARQDLESGATDAMLFLAGIGSLGGLRPGSRLALDVEEHGGSGPQVDPHANLAAYCLDWYETVVRATGVKPFLYSRRQYLIDHALTSNPYLDGVFDLWLVWDGNPTPPPGWSRVAMWQHLDDAMSVPGITGQVDHNEFMGIAYGWLSKAWGYIPLPVSATTDTPDVDPNLDTPSILRHMSDTLRALHADTSILITRGGLIG